jgi:hypothetical protein
MSEAKWMERNAYDGEPHATMDEDGEVAYVAVTRTTRTREEALAWLVENFASQMGYGDTGRVDVDRVKWVGLTCEAGGVVLDDLVPLRSLVVSGRAKAWWRFEVYGAVQHGDEEELREWMERRDRDSEAEQRRRAREWRGPLWWRAKLRLALRLKVWGARLEPTDWTRAYWREANGERVEVDVRRPPWRKGEERW